MCQANGVYSLEEIEKMIRLFEETVFNFNSEADLDPILTQLANINPIEVGKLVIKYGIDINREIKGSTLLCEAVNKRIATIVEFLILCGADPNIFYSNLYPPIVLAAANNDSLSIKALLKHPTIDINIKTHCTAFYAATQQGHEEIIDLLFEHNANPLLCADNGASPLHIAVANDNLAIVRKLCAMAPKLIDQKRKASLNESPLHVAVNKGFLQSVTVLLENGANVNTIYKNNITPLYIAACHGHTTIAKKLLEYNADHTIGAYEEQNISVLSRASQNLHLDLVELLLTYPHSPETLSQTLCDLIVTYYRIFEGQEQEILYGITKVIELKSSYYKQPLINEASEENFKSNNNKALQAFSFFKNPNHPNILQKLHTALKYVKDVCILGSSNKIEDILHSSGWSRQQSYRGMHSYYKKLSDSKPLKEDKLVNLTLDTQNKWICHIKNWYLHAEEEADKGVHLHPVGNNKMLDKFNLNTEHEFLIKSAIFTINSRVGNCSDKACLIGKYLWENALGIHRIEIVHMQCDHSFVIVNRRGDLNNASSWGNAWIIDAWYKNGVIFPASEFNEKIVEITEYLKFQNKAQEEISITVSEEDKQNLEKELKLCTLIEIYPHIHKYPSDNKYKSIEDYYRVSNIYPQNIFNNLETFKKNHQDQFKNCLDVISSGLGAIASLMRG